MINCVNSYPHAALVSNFGNDIAGGLLISLAVHIMYTLYFV